MTQAGDAIRIARSDHVHNITNSSSNWDSGTLTIGTSNPIYTTTSATYTPFFTTQDIEAIKARIVKLENDLSLFMDLFREQASKECESGESCEECLPCRSRALMLNEAKRALDALAS